MLEIMVMSLIIVAVLIRIMFVTIATVMILVGLLPIAAPSKSRKNTTSTTSTRNNGNELDRIGSSNTRNNCQPPIVVMLVRLMLAAARLPGNLI